MTIITNIYVQKNKLNEDVDQQFTNNDRWLSFCIALGDIPSGSLLPRLL